MENDFGGRRAGLPVYAHYQLIIDELTRQRPLAAPSVLKFSSEEHLSRPWRYVIEFTSPLAALPASAIVNQPAFLLLHPDSLIGFTPPTPRTIAGFVTAFGELDSSADETRYQLVLQPRLALLDNGINSAIYQNQSVIDVVESILRNHGFTPVDYRSELETTFPSRPFIHQYQESDYAFIARLLADVGIWFRFEYDAEFQRDVLVLAEAGWGALQGPAIPFRHPAGLFDGGLESVWQISVETQALPRQVRLDDENPRLAGHSLLALCEIAPDNRLAHGEVYLYGEHYLTPGKAHQLEAEQGLWYAQVRAERYQAQEIIFRGQSNAMELKPGMSITTPGKSWPQAPNGLLIVSTTAREIGRSTAYTVSFTAIPRDGERTYRPPLLPWPKIAGTLPARISGPLDHPDYADLTIEGEYRVKFGFDQQSHWYKGMESCPLRLARPYAGETYGWHFPLLAGTPVMIGFINGDPDRPYITAALHDSGSPDVVNRYSDHRNVLRTPRNNKIRIDDEKNEEHIKISTDYAGKTQLNLGHMVNSKRRKRGDGFELRSDSYGALRGGKGLLLTTETKTAAQGQQLDMADTVQQLQAALALARSLQQRAQLAQASPADTAAQQQLIDELNELSQPGVVVYGDGGIAQVTPKTLQHSAGENLVATAGQDASFSILRRFSVAAGEMFSVFARRLGIKLIAAAGKVQIQAQQDQMELTAFADLQLTSSDGRIVLNAKKELLLMCGGAGIRIKDGIVEQLAPARIVLKSPQLIYQEGESVSQAMPLFAREDAGLKYRLHMDGDPGHVLVRQKFRLHRQDGSVAEGVTDDNGESPLLNINELENATIELIKGVI